MTKFTDVTIRRPFVGRAVAVLVVVAASIAATLLAAAAFASSGHGGKLRTVSKRTGISVFSHPPKRLARIAIAGALNPAPGAILASVVGRNEVYALHHSGGEDCVMTLHVGGTGGGACSKAAQVEEEGAVGIFVEGSGATAALRVAALVPDGVEVVTFTDRDGTSREIAVTNNVVELEDDNISSVSYTVPDGAGRPVRVA